jgi:hypothetical protein
MTNPLDFLQTDLVALDYGAKQDMLLLIAQRMLDIKTELITVSGRYAEIKAEIDMLKHAGQFIQSELKATQVIGGGRFDK